MIPNKKLSIIVPNYKNEKYLERTLKSLIEQTYKNIEIVVVCDKPEEDCDKLVKSYIEKDNRIIYIKNDERLPEKNKELNPLEWTKLMNNYKNMAEEIVLNEYVFV